MTQTVTCTELESLAKYVEHVCGIVLDQTKTYLVQSRLGPLLEHHGIQDYDALKRKAEADSTGKIRRQIIDRITTNETSFFRDKHPFDLLAHKLVPDHFEKAPSVGKPTLKIWSAACSSGQEAYSIAITLKELLGDFSSYVIRILGTDLSDEILTYASTARYTKHEMSRGISAEHLRRHFTQHEDQWRVNDDLRSIAFFQKANLLEPLDRFGRFDVIFCRNVAIYFSKENRKMLFENLAARLNPKGVLIIGSTESLVGVTDCYKRQDFRGKIYYEKV